MWKGKRPKKNKTFKSPSLIAWDALIDDTLYHIKNFISSFWANSVAISRYLYISSGKRLLVGLLDEIFTLGLIGLTIFTLCAISVLEITKADWRAKQELSVTFLDRHKNVIGTRGALHDASVPVDQLPDYVIKAILATEDRRFFEHWGLDFYGLSRALSQNLKSNGVVQGGSTLTQQLAKNLFLTNERTISRKIKEAFLSLWLEANYTKKQILQLYIDNAYMGAGTLGLAAASKFYFGKDIRDVSLAEAAMLAGLFKAPTKYAPHVNFSASQERANTVLQNLINSGYMNKGEILRAQKEPVKIISNNKHNSPDYFLDWAFSEIQKISDKLPEHKLVVHTTLDSTIQTMAQNTIEKYLAEYGKPFQVQQAALVTLDNNGAVRAMVGGRDYSESRYNRATQDGRQPGSSFKPYIYAVLMEKGLTPDTMTVDAPINWGGWQPNNNNKGHFAGRVSIANALARSINTVPVRLTYQYLKGDTQPIRALIKNMGIDAKIFSHKTMILGTSNMTPLQQAIGFNVFANGGLAGTTHGFTRIVSSKGKVLWDWQYNGPKPHRALSEKASAYMNQMLINVPIKGSGRRAALPMTRVAGKTGTSQMHRDAWFVGFTGNYTTAVWMGNDNFSPTNRLFGGTIPAMIFKDVMEAAHKNVPLKPLFGVPDSILIKNDKAFTNPDQEEELPQILSPVTTEVISKIRNDIKTNKVRN